MNPPLARRELAIFALLGFGVWFSGALTFRFGGHLMFESGPIATVMSALVIAFSVCLMLKAAMGWRGAAAYQAVTVAVVMALPGLFGDVAYIWAFPALTGLRPLTAATFAGVVIFGNAVLLAFAVVRSQLVPD
jgi:hypothetical protein